MEKDILHEIIARKRIEIIRQKEAVSEARLEEMLDGKITAGHSMKEALKTSPIGIIAEFKRRSPSKGWIRKEADPTEVVSRYGEAGASALSVLTDEEFFGGTLKDLHMARNATHLPILRKDFIISRYQLLQARLAEADAVLLIAAALTPSFCRELADEAHKLHLEVLLEIHTEKELEHYNGSVDMVGVNNRNLGTFHTDVENSFRMAERLPPDAIHVSESGIASPETVLRLREAGYRGFLMGEAFMKTPDPGKALSEFHQVLMEKIKKHPHQSTGLYPFSHPKNTQI